FGPHMENFAVLARSLVARNGAAQVSDRDQLEQALRYLLSDQDARLRLIHNAEEVLTEHRGAAARTAQLIDPLVPPLRWRAVTPPSGPLRCPPYRPALKLARSCLPDIECHVGR